MDREWQPSQKERGRLAREFHPQISRGRAVRAPIVRGILKGLFHQKNAVFTRHLTKPGGCVLLWQLQPKSGFLPEAGRGRTKLLKVI